MAHRRSIAVGCVGFLLVIGGCLAGGVGQPPTPTRTPVPGTPMQPPSAACATGVSFYGLDGPGETAWAPDRVAIGYSVTANASVFFVAFEDRRVLGSTHVKTHALEYGLTVDGDGIPLRRSLSGPHAIRVAAYADTNGNGRFDPGTDRPCRSEGERVYAGPRRIDFSSLQYTHTPPTEAPAS